jgi:thioredoxin-dependent peroxiredoxin
MYATGLRYFPLHTYQLHWMHNRKAGRKDNFIPSFLQKCSSFNLFVNYSKHLFMALRIGDKAPDFTASSTLGELNLYEYLGSSWGILLSHPADYTPVCTTELGRTAQLHDALEQRDVKVVAVSIDALHKHIGWSQDIMETQNATVTFPMVADEQRIVATLYDMIHPNASTTATVRSLFVIDPAKVIRLIMVYPASTGRNFNEVLRVIDSLQLADRYSVATPADWQQGDNVIVALSVTDEQAREQFPKGVHAVKPYLRFTPQPDRDTR